MAKHDRLGLSRVVKLWQRGTPLEQAKTVFSGDKSSVAVSGWVIFDDKTPLSLVTEAHTFTPLLNMFTKMAN